MKRTNRIYPKSYVKAYDYPHLRFRPGYPLGTWAVKRPLQDETAEEFYDRMLHAMVKNLKDTKGIRLSEPTPEMFEEADRLTKEYFPNY